MRIKSSTIYRLAFTLLFISFTSVFAGKSDLSSPIGYWKTVDDETKKAKSVVHITESGGKIKARVIKLLNREGKDPNPLCTECKGKNKDKTIIGLRIIRGLTKDGDEWSGGKILDPDNGKEYKCYIQVQDAGKKLKVRGYIGFALLGRTQYWYRVSDPEKVK